MLGCSRWAQPTLHGKGVVIETGNPGDVEPVGEGVAERRINYGPGYRVYFGQDGRQLVILLVGGTKKRQQRDIVQAKAYWRNYKKRKEGG
ncbi:type II toxin-antitoxin system RelE/ParE family toxin [Candidatus Thiosymbion oneisti]|uniref:type II toxin-antitoxin system RelE/ParE family toxin n=1 Tax=Candidatus Thiosymbion oneisti TaxID=589554 RepID=UPI00311CCD2C